MNVASDTGEVTGAAAQPRRLAILALLARAGDRGIQREKIVALLWPDDEEQHARKILAKAIYALRRDLGDEEAVVGASSDLRLNSDVISSDVREFELALAVGDLERAVTIYAGPFLDAFRLSSAPEFERWVETERDALARDYELALEKLATLESGRGNHTAAVRWLRKLSAQDPLNARHAVRLMRALAESGDRLGALQHARVYEALVEQELDMPPDRDVVALAAQLRRDQAAAAPRASTPQASRPEPIAPPARPVAAEPAGVASQPMVGSPDLPRTVIAPRRIRQTKWIVAVVGTIALAAGGTWAARSRAFASAIDDGVIAVGRITDYRRAAKSELARPLGDMLATNLARAPELRVLSTSRMYELMSASEAGTDTGSAGMLAAARRAGARSLVDGALFQLGNGSLRLDLRLVELGSGNVIVAHTVTGADPFSLVDSATALIVARTGAAIPAGSIADVSTRSIVAYRLYEEGLRAYTNGDIPSARRLLSAASAEDSTFAMAAFYAARSAQKGGTWAESWERFAAARRFSRRSSERERMVIDLEFRLQSYSPLVAALADSFVARFPHEVDGHLYSGLAAIADGRFLDAIPKLRRVIEMDSAAALTASARCVACEAASALLITYNALDSIDAMVRAGRAWTQLQPKSANSWVGLASALSTAGKTGEALAVLRTSAAFSSIADEAEGQAHLRIRSGDFADADRELLDVVRGHDPSRRAEMLWLLALSYRTQGRLTEALAQAREFRRIAIYGDPVQASASSSAIAEAIVHFDRGDHARSAALFDSLATVVVTPELESFAAKTRSWMLAHAATASAAMGDTVRLRWLIDTLRVTGARSNLRRDQRLHHYARGLLLVARKQDEAAAAEFRQAIWSTTLGFTRENYELGKAYLRLGRPSDAVAIVQPALRGGVDASNLYITRTELHELLAQAWAAAGIRDSARVHYREVARAWARADAMFAARRDSAEREAAR